MAIGPLLIDFVPYSKYFVDSQPYNNWFIGYCIVISSNNGEMEYQDSVT